MVVISPADEVETKEVMAWALGYEGPVFIRLVRDVTQQLFQPGHKFQFGRVKTVREGSDITVNAVHPGLIFTNLGIGELQMPPRDALAELARVTAPGGQVLVTLLVWAWALRLTANWARGFAGLGHEDAVEVGADVVVEGVEGVAAALEVDADLDVGPGGDGVLEVEGVAGARGGGAGERGGRGPGGADPGRAQPDPQRRGRRPLGRGGGAGHRPGSRHTGRRGD